MSESDHYTSSVSGTQGGLAFDEKAADLEELSSERSVPARGAEEAPGLADRLRELMNTVASQAHSDA